MAENTTYGIWEESKPAKSVRFLAGVWKENSVVTVKKAWLPLMDLFRNQEIEINIDLNELENVLRSLSYLK